MRVSVASDGTQANAATTFTNISPDGRYVSFASTASNLVAGDTNAASDVFVRDWVAGTTERVSVDSGGVQGNSASWSPSISADGRYVAFYSFASNLVAGDTNGVYDVFVRDRLVGTTERVSVDSSGVQGNNTSAVIGLSISADGRYVVFGSTASNLVAGDTNGTSDVFVRDRTAGTTQRVSVNSDGSQRSTDSGSGSISADGRSVAFYSDTVNNLYVRDRTAGTTEQVNVDSAEIPGNSGAYDPSISADGRYVTFYSFATNLVAGDTGGWSDVFVRDRTAGTTERVSVDSAGVQGTSHSYSSTISSDGRYVAFYSAASNLVAGDTNGTSDSFVRDRLVGTTERVSVDSGGTQGNGPSPVPVISADGRYVAFQSAASNLVAGDSNGTDDVFLKERQLVQAPLPDGAVTPESRRGGGSPSELLDCPTPRADPCDVSTGNFFETVADLSIPGRGMPLSFTRTYSSIPSPSAPADGPLGYGWSYTYGMSLTTGTNPTVTEENGAQVTFTGTGPYTAPPRVLATLIHNGDGTWTFTRRAREIYTFNSSGQLTSVTDLNGSTTTKTLTYVSGKLTTVTDPVGRTLTLGWTGTHITSVTDTASPARSVTFTYASSNLTEVVDVGGGHTQYGYDTNHRMNSKREPKYFGDTITNPAPVTTNTYDASGRIATQTDPLGRITTFDYSTPGSTKVTDPKGNVRVDVFTYGLLTARTLGFGTAQAATWSYTYDPATLGRTSTLEPNVGSNGDLTTTIYASEGNPLSTTDQLGRTTARTFNGLREPLTVRDPLNVTTSYFYDAAGNIQSELAPITGGPRITTYTYGDLSHPGDVTSITDPDSKIWPQTWDTSGNLSTKVDPLGNTTLSCYDTVGRKTKEIAPKGTAAGVTCATGSPTFTTLITTDAFGAAISVTDANGHTTQTSYDLNRNKASTTDALGQTTSYSYDPTNQLIEQSNPWSVLLSDDFTGTSGSWNTDRWGITTGVTLSGNQGVLASAATPARATAKTMADTIDSDATFTYAFSATGNSTLRVALRASGGDKTTGADMPNGYRLEINPSTAQIQLTKIVAGTVTNLGAAVGYASGTAAQRLRFQVQGSIIRAKAWAATTSEPTIWTIEQSDTSVTTAGVMQLSHIQASGTQNVTIDDLTVLDAATPQGAAWTSPVRVSDDWTGADGTAWNSDRWGTTGSGVDLSGNQGRLAVSTQAVRGTAKAMPDVADSETTLSYALSNRTASTLFRVVLRGSGASKTSGAQMPNGYRLDIGATATTIRITKIVNNVVTDLGGFSYPKDTNRQQVRFQVQGSTIRAKVWPAGTSEPATWSKEVTDTSIATPGVLQLIHSWTSGSNDVKVDDLAVRVGNSVRYDYNLDGTLYHSYDGASQATTRAYDAQGRVTSVTDPLSRVTSYGYDPAGTRTTQQDPGGNCALSTGCTTMSYDAANQMTGINYSDSGTPDVTIGYDLDGRRTSMVDGTGTSSWAWDSLGRLTSSTNGAGKIVGYGYDLRGNRTTITYPGSTGIVTQTFDNASRLSKVKDWLNHETVFNYDADSFMTSQVYPNTTTATYSPDNADGLKTVSHAPTGSPGSPFANFDYTRDNNDHLSSGTETVNPPAVADNRTWTYSANDQLKTDNGALYATDDATNLIRQTSGAVQGYDTASEMTSTSTISVVGATGAADSTSTSLPLTLPAGTVTNDQIILAATVPFAQTPTTPTGYTAVNTYTAGTTAKVIVYRRTALAGDTSVTVNFGAAYGKALNLAVYRGVNPNSPIDTSQSANGTTTTSVTVPSLTSTVPGERLLLVEGAIPTTSGSWSTPVGMTPEGNQQQPANGSAAGLLTDQAGLTASASGPRPITFSTSGALIGVLLALKPNQTTYGYDSRGNRTSVTPPGGIATTLTYNQVNRLTAYGTTATYNYDGDGLRISKTVSGSTSAFTWDDAGELLVDGTTNYVYGPDGLPLEQITSVGLVTYYHRDSVGSTRALTNTAGTVIATYTYDAYGKLTASTGSSTNPFGYAGQYTDTETGLIYQRARYYDPATAQSMGSRANKGVSTPAAKKRTAKTLHFLPSIIQSTKTGNVLWNIGISDWYEPANDGLGAYKIELNGIVRRSNWYTWSDDGEEAVAHNEEQCEVGHWSASASGSRRGHGSDAQTDSVIVTSCDHSLFGTALRGAGNAASSAARAGVLLAKDIVELIVAVGETIEVVPPPV